MRVSGSIVHSGMHQSYSSIPLFSFDSGVILRPSTTTLYCAYGMDGGIDDGSNRPMICKDTEINEGSCLPGCGEPPDWCDPADPGKGGWPGYFCGFMYGPDGIGAWRPKDLPTLLHHQESMGVDYHGIGNFKGYNEMVIAADGWIANLPESIEAIFITDCSSGQSNLAYNGANGGTASSCGAAHEQGRNAHKAFLQEYGLTEDEFPLLILKPDHWDAPFALAKP